MKTATALIACAAGLASAFPVQSNDPQVAATAARILHRRGLLSDPLGISRGETNCGPSPCLGFTEEQLVSVHGDNEYAAPGPDEIRGPCPGLNAAANHGYLPRSGIVTIEETIAGLGSAFGMSPELAAALAAYAVAIDGNVLETSWSIGGPLPSDPLNGQLLGTGQGLSYSHNNYEGDASIGRNDAYINNGDAHSLNVSKFQEVYDLGGPEDRYTLDKFRKQFGSVQQRSIATNPYYFTGAFSTIVVVPAAYNFVINFMSNHSAEEPSGYLDGETFKAFFGVTGESGNFTWQKGQERIPENWYRRPATTPYTLSDVVEDVLTTYIAYPETLLVGGNTGKVNSFLGVNLSNLTQNVYALENLADADNFACFVTVLLQQGLANFLDDIVNDLVPVVDLVTDVLAPFVGNLSCPQIGQYDFTLFEQFPGYKYHPSGPDTNY